MNTKLFLAVWILGLCLVLVYGIKSKKSMSVPEISNQQPIPPPIQPVNPQPQPPIEQKIEPEWTECPPLRQVESNLGKVLADIESHMPAGHIYRDNDKITWGHETSHGIASRLRNQHQPGRVSGWNGIVWRQVYGAARINCFYVLDNKAVIIEEPKTTISQTASLVPKSLRGEVYDLYLVKQAQSWQNTPLYLFDEWVAYGNGTAVRSDLKIQDRQESIQFMLEFNNYAICLAMACKSEDPQFKRFLMWNLERSMRLYEENREIGDTSRSTAFLEKTKNSADAEPMRQFARSYFGTDWTKKILGY